MRQKVSFAKSVISCQCLAGYSNCSSGSRMPVVVEGHTYSSLLHLFILKLLFPEISCSPWPGPGKGAVNYFVQSLDPELVTTFKRINHSGSPDCRDRTVSKRVLRSKDVAAS